MVLLNLIFASVFVIVNVAGFGFRIYWIESGRTCRRIGAPDEHCVHSSNCSPKNRRIKNVRTEFCRLNGLFSAVLCCAKDYSPYESSEEQYSSSLSYNINNLHDRYDYEPKPPTSSYPENYPEQKPRPQNNYLPTNSLHNNQNPIVQRPSYQSTDAVQNPFSTYQMNQRPQSMFPINEDDIHKPPPSYPGYQPEQIPRPENNYYPPNYGDQKPIIQRPVESIIQNSNFISPTPQSSISNTPDHGKVDNTNKGTNSEVDRNPMFSVNQDQPPPNYLGYQPQQTPRPENNYFAPNFGFGDLKPIIQRPTESIIQNTNFISPTVQRPQPPISNTPDHGKVSNTGTQSGNVMPSISNTPDHGKVSNADRQIGNGMSGISNIPTQQQGNPPVSVQLPPMIASSGIGVQKCRESFRALPLTRPRHTPIIGGRPANPQEFPHLVLLGYGSADNKNWQCGGTLISEQYVLTAAHCLSSRIFGEVRFIRLGELDLSTTLDDAEERDFDVLERIRYPMYTFGSNYHDIALLRFNGNLTFNPYIRPACIAFTQDVKNVTLIAVGWGVTEEGGVTASLLQRTTLKHVANERCRAAYGTPRNLRGGVIESIQVCADGGMERRDACQGDSGGPLQYTNYDFDTALGGIIEVVGITSFGRGCGRTAGVYTRVLPYVPWIESIVWR